MIGYDEGKNNLHLRKREVCFSYYQKYFGIDDSVGNLLEHLPLLKDMFLVLEERLVICWRCSTT